MVILKLAGRVLLVPLWFIISIIGAGVKLLVHMVAIAKKILGFGIMALLIATRLRTVTGVQTCALPIYRNSDLLPRLAPGSFSGLYGRCSDFCFICWRIYRYCNRLA